MYYIDFQEGDQTRFLRDVKMRTKLTWRKLADKLKVNRSMIFFYLNEHSKLPESHYKMLCKMARKRIVRQKRVIIKNKENSIRKTKTSENVAEFLGLLAGDGHINSNTFEVSVTLNAKSDKRYVERVLYLIKSLFGLSARTYAQPNYGKIKCYVYSKQLVHMLHKRFSVPVGKKKGSLRIPKNILSNDRLLAAYLRGLFDTDGSIHRHNKNSAMLGFASADINFLTDIHKGMKKLGYTAYKGKRNVYIYRKEQISKFFTQVKPSNLKHTDKFRYYRQHGSVPLTTAHQLDL
jgi:DNA-binding transcriptional regulator WhiA